MYQRSGKKILAIVTARARIGETCDKIHGKNIETRR
jgi:hypothetical protein